MPAPKAQIRTLLVAIGGATSSGKTLLASHVAGVLPRCLVIHQDDFAPDESLLPLKNGVQDWDAAPTAIDWPLVRRALAHARATGEALPELHSHDHLNKVERVEVRGELLQRWRERIGGLVAEEAREGVEWRIVLVDGFLLFWDEESNRQYDVRVLLRVPREVIKARREARAQYVIQTGAVWSDPPGYFDDIVYPAYVDAHAKMFTGGDVEKGRLTTGWSAEGGDAEADDDAAVAAQREGEGEGKGKGEGEGKGAAAEPTPVTLLEPAEGSEGMETMVDRTLGLVFDAIKRI